MGKFSKGRKEIMKNKSYQLLVWFSVMPILLLTSCSPIQRTATSTGSQYIALELTLELDQSVYSNYQAIAANLSLKNTGDSNLVVHARMVPGLPSSPAPFRDISFEIVSSSGTAA
jgi:hypothetical protein